MNDDAIETSEGGSVQSMASPKTLMTVSSRLLTRLRVRSCVMYGGSDGSDVSSTEADETAFGVSGCVIVDPRWRVEGLVGSGTVVDTLFATNFSMSSFRLSANVSERPKVSPRSTSTS